MFCTRKWCFWVLAILISTGCSGDKTYTPKSFRYRLGTDPPTLDPAYSTDTSSAAIVLHIYDGLVRFDPETMDVIPAVAESWEISEDGLDYVFHLKRGVKFHNKREVKAEDFKYSFERVLSPKTGSPRTWVLEPILGSLEFMEGNADNLYGVNVIDDYTLKIRLEKPFAPFLAQLCMEAASAVPVEEVERWGEDFTSHPVGCGPYRFVEWNHDINVKLEAFDEYYDRVPQLKSVEYVVVPDVSVAYQKYLAGELDLLNEIPPGQLKATVDRYPDEVKVWPVLTIYYLGFNHSKPPFKDNLKLRQAICYAIDRESICQVIQEGAATPAKGILPPGIPGHDPTIEGYEFDLDRAESLLEEAGYPQGMGLPPITLWYNTNEHHERVAQFVQSNLKKIGVEVKLKSLDWAAYLQACENNEPEFYRLGWVADYPDADNFLYILLHSSQTGASGNYSRYSNPHFDRLVEDARVTSDPQKRISLYTEADRLATRDAAWAVIYYQSEQMMIKPKWKGLVLPAQGDFVIPLGDLYHEPSVVSSSLELSPSR